MPTAQSSSSSSTQSKQNKGTKNVIASNSNLDNKIAKAAAKVAESSTARVSSQENTRATTPDQQNVPVSNQGGNKTPQEQPEFIKQAMIIIEKKVRNLDKRRIKLEEYRATQAKGETLNDDQLLAVSRYDEVIRTLELSRELEKQFIQLANDALKQQKKQIKKEQTEREEAIKEKLKESNKIITLLNEFTQESVRNDFLNEANGASKLNEHEIIALEQFRNLVLPTNQINKQLDSTSSESAEHIFNLIEGKNKQIGQLNAQAVGAAFTYADLKKLFDRIICSPYWKKREESNYDSPQISAVSKIEDTVPNSESDKMVESSNINEQLNQLNIDEQSRIQQNCNENNSNSAVDQAVYHQQNTSEDYILVSSTEYSGGENSQNKASKTFFSTLNPQDSVNRNINEFLNRCEKNDDCINFLQDSEIQQHEMQHQNHPQENEHTNQQQDNNMQESDHYQTGYDQRTQSQSMTNYQDFPINQDLNKDNRGHRQQREYNNGPRNNNNQSNQFQQRPRYQDDQRGPRRSGAGGSAGMNNGQINSQTRNGGGNSAGYKGNRGLAGSGNNRGEYRGSGGNSNYQSGPRQGGGSGGGNGGNPRYAPRISENRQQDI